MPATSIAENMSPELLKVTERAKQEPAFRFSSVAHLINEAALARAYHRLRKDAAVGVDGITVEQYGQDLEENLKKLAEKENLKKTVLTIDNAGGPKNMKISKDADVTVVVYLKKETKANFAFKKGELNSAQVDKIVAEFGKISEESKK